MAFGCGSKPVLPFWGKIILVYLWGLGCSLGVRAFDPWPFVDDCMFVLWRAATRRPSDFTSANVLYVPRRPCATEDVRMMTLFSPSFQQWRFLFAISSVILERSPRNTGRGRSFESVFQECRKARSLWLASVCSWYFPSLGMPVLALLLTLFLPVFLEFLAMLLMLNW